jgi:hypothetical protein
MALVANKFIIFFKYSQKVVYLTSLFEISMFEFKNI